VGGARSLLHYGPQTTQKIDAEVGFCDDHHCNTYTVALASAAPDTLVFTNEAVEYYQGGYPVPMESFLGSGQKESKLEEEARGDNAKAKVMFSLLRSCRTYQFHDTSANANIRKSCYIDDSKYLRADGGNLASFLYRLQDTHPKHFDRIVRTIQQVCPQFGRFELRPTARDSRSILLNWYERHASGYLMGPHQLSDGTLRFMALATLFLQPPELLPSVIVIDEPELGLHPQATAALAGMINGLAGQAQVILATQSETLVNHFSLDQIRVIEHTKGTSHFLDLDPEKYRDWLDEYTTGELWEKNIFGGGPRHE
jgi:predicted ATPase